MSSEGQNTREASGTIHVGNFANSNVTSNDYFFLYISQQHAEHGSVPTQDTEIMSVVIYLDMA